MGADDPLRHPPLEHPPERAGRLCPNCTYRPMGSLEPRLYAIEDVLLPAHPWGDPESSTKERTALET